MGRKECSLEMKDGQRWRQVGEVLWAEQGGSGWEAAWPKDALVSLRHFRGGASY